MHQISNPWKAAANASKCKGKTCQRLRILSAEYEDSIWVPLIPDTTCPRGLQAGCLDLIAPVGISGTWRG